MQHSNNAPISVEQMAQAFEAEEAEVDLSPYAFEDWLTLILFWGMALCVVLQFVTRYVLNNSLAWTEEMAMNALVVIVFLGSVMCVRLVRHIQVDILYRFLPNMLVRTLEIATDLLCIGFYGYMSWLYWRYLDIVGSERMVTVDLPRGIVFYTVFAAFVLMTLRSLHNFYKDMTSEKTVRELAAESGAVGGI
jgi:TRAP-type C4-dicarboxylate transport system permease small subunit